jgi:telomerase protein component 1
VAITSEDDDDMPQYDFSIAKSHDVSHDLTMDMLPATSNAVSVDNLTSKAVKLKTNLVRTVANSLLSSPDFRNKRDPMVVHLRKLATSLSRYDEEFLLKVALYTRCDLNIRSTANFLLALSANNLTHRPYLKKYFNASIRLPSDWIEVAEIYQSFHDKSLNFGSLPVALRKVMAKKFPDFDEYQLAKYNKDTRVKKKKKKGKKGRDAPIAAPVRVRSDPPPKKTPVTVKPVAKQRSLKAPETSSDSDSDDSSDDETLVESTDSESEEELERLKFTLKQIIPKVHISQPVYHVMCLLGKKYPETPEDFRRSGLPGIWDQDRANKRMKLATPETWETQISLRGNKAHVWEELIDHKKLPFMAMLRNLRNLLIAGISKRHHQWVINKLTDERAVINSRQFPFRFFSAYEVLQQLENPSTVISTFQVRKRINPMKRQPKPKTLPNVEVDLIRRYNKCLGLRPDDIHQL